MNLPSLKTRAATLRTQLDARFAHGNKRSLSHCEAMDVLAACDGERSRAAVLQREAAGSAPPAVEPADATEPLAPPVPLEALAFFTECALATVESPRQERALRAGGGTRTSPTTWSSNAAGSASTRPSGTVPSERYG